MRIGLNVRRMRTAIRQRIDPGLEVGSFPDQRGRGFRVAGFLSEFQKRRYLARNVLPTCHRISPLGYVPRLNTLRRGNRSRHLQK